MAIEIRVPSLGESISEATVGQWLKQQGDQVAADEPLVELETDKVTVEVPAPAAAFLSEIAVPTGATVAIGSLLGSITEGACQAFAGTGSSLRRHQARAHRPAGACSKTNHARTRAKPA